PPAAAPTGRRSRERPTGPGGRPAPSNSEPQRSGAFQAGAGGQFGAPTDAASPPTSGRRAKKRVRRERATEAVREVLAPTGFEPEELAQRLPDTLRGVGEQALVAVRKWADPRERELRKRRRARRRSFRLGTASGLTTAGTVGLVLISAPAWAVVVVGGGAVALVTGTAVTARRYLDMRREPLPQAAFVPRKLPPIRSAARGSIARLVRAERALHGLHAQIARSGRLLAEDLDDTLETAASGAAALHALALDVVAMERAAGALGANSPLGEHVRAVSVRLDGGVVEFEGMVEAAARVLAVPESAAVADDLGWAMVGLRDAADRLDGWAQALTELADQRFRANP
ncbi:phage shock envelope stress response protein PspM, partial [Nocardia sp. NPDC004582]